MKSYDYQTTACVRLKADATGLLEHRLLLLNGHIHYAKLSSGPFLGFQKQYIL